MRVAVAVLALAGLAVPTLSLADDAHDAYCRHYADMAVAAFNASIAVGCNGKLMNLYNTGPWSNNWDGHYQWCLGQSGTAAPEQENQIRRQNWRFYCPGPFPPDVVAAPAPPPVPPAPQQGGVPLERIPTPAPPTAGVNFTGLWATLHSNGTRHRLYLTQDKAGQVSGTYSPGDGHIDGRVSGNKLTGKWSQGEGFGYVQFTLASNGSFTGIWTNGGTAASLSTKPAGSWDGYRFPANFPDGPTAGVRTKDGKRYNYPYITAPTGEVVLLDWCREWGVNCGKPAADAFCASVDGGRLPIATSFKDFQRAVRFKPSMTIGSRQICNDPACTGFEYIVCSASAAAATPAPGKSSQGVSFAGAWTAQTGDGTAYTIGLTQSGNSVTGNYQGGDGSLGLIVGSVAGNLLSFAWNQADGLSGYGWFTLSSDGRSFQGSYSMSQTPQKIEGSWNGSRR